MFQPAPEPRRGPAHRVSQHRSGESAALRSSRGTFTGMAVRWLLLVLSLAFTLGLVEVALRALPSAVVGYAYRDGVFVPPTEFIRRNERNSLGAHDIEPAAADPGRVRVLLLGDSYVESISMPIDHSLPRRVAVHLESQRPGAYDLVSLSKGGWGQREELEALERYGPSLQPDRVVLLFTARNDPLNNARDLPGHEENLRLRGQMLEEGRAWSRAFRADQAVGLWFPRSALNRLISHRMTVAQLRPMDPVPLQFLAFSPDRQPMWVATWKQTGLLLRQLRAASEALGATFEVMSASLPEGVLPVEEGADRLRSAHALFDGLRFDVDLPDRRLAQLCAELGIPFLALQPSLRVLEGPAGPLHWRYDGHWNRAGNDRAGELIATQIIKTARQ